MEFQSILFPSRETAEEPDFFHDLNLDQIVDSITSGKKDYDLKPFFQSGPCDAEVIAYRQEIMRDLEGPFLAKIKAFAEKMRRVVRYREMTEKLDYPYHREGWFLETTLLYIETVEELARDLSEADLTSRGLTSFLEYISAYTNSEYFVLLGEEARRLKASLAALSYCFLIKGLNVKVMKYDSESDYSEEVEKTFERFRQGAVKDYLVKLPIASGMNHVEAKILELTSKLFPEEFSALLGFYAKHGDFMNGKIERFDREIQFYVSYLDYIAKFRRRGLSFCYPTVATDDKAVFVEGGFDLALAEKLAAGDSTPVCNDFYLNDPERIIVVSGPNQGGKTTFARFFGQVHYLACLGCPVPGREARLFRFDRIYTHFEREENIENLNGKLQDDLKRIHEILVSATSDSIVIMNEIFTSTTLKDAVFLGKKVIERIQELDLLCVCVTFLDELASFSEKTVSMMSSVFPDDPAVRTYRIERKPADGLTYALCIAEKYRLTYEALKERLRV